jgi:hypothetical protein
LLEQVSDPLLSSEEEDLHRLIRYATSLVSDIKQLDIAIRYAGHHDIPPDSVRGG